MEKWKELTLESIAAYQEAEDEKARKNQTGHIALTKKAKSVEKTAENALRSILKTGYIENRIEEGMMPEKAFLDYIYTMCFYYIEERIEHGQKYLQRERDKGRIERYKARLIELHSISSSIHDCIRKNKE